MSGIESLCADIANKLHESGVRCSGEVDSVGIALCRVPGVPGLMSLGDVVSQMMLGAIGQLLRRNEMAPPWLKTPEESAPQPAIGGGMVIGGAPLGGSDESKAG